MYHLSMPVAGHDTTWPGNGVPAMFRQTTEHRHVRSQIPLCVGPKALF
jgi:hypothetical protein